MYGETNIDSLLIQLDKSILEKPKHDTSKESRLKELKQILSEPNTTGAHKLFIQTKLIKEYEAYQFDSVISYIHKNLELSLALRNTNTLYKTKLYLAKILANTGRYKESLDILNGIDRKKIDQELIQEYFANYMLVYAELKSYSKIDLNLFAYHDLFNFYRDSLLAITPPESDEYLSIIERQLREKHKEKQSIAINSKRLARTHLGERNYSIACYERAIAYEAMGNFAMEKKFLILSSISDIKGSIKDNASLTKLAMVLFKEGEIERAYKYINNSFNDADFFNSKMRLINISNILSVINTSFQNRNNIQKSRLRTSLIIISILFFVLLLSFLLIIKQINKIKYARNKLQNINQQLEGLNSNLQMANTQLSDLNNELYETNHVKEEYIGNFLSICSDYIDKLENYRKIIHKNVLQKKYADLLELSKSKQILEDEIRAFYDNFDHTFLHIYPAFVEELNALLLPNEIIVLKKDEVLNTELRIFALIRLGITDSSAIARLLRYSVNTIYNYRVKIKNKAAVDREKFEDHVKKIGSFSK